MPPVPPAPWRGVPTPPRSARRARSQARKPNQSEDCLFLNVTAPLAKAARPRPVIVYIHGGAYSSGSGSSPLYDGANAVPARRRGRGHRQSPPEPVRLSLSTRDFPTPATRECSTWCWRCNGCATTSAAFGGDPGCVTLLGQSGGGAKIATLMAMPAAAGPVPSRRDDERPAADGLRARCMPPGARACCSTSSACPRNARRELASLPADGTAARARRLPSIRTSAAAASTWVRCSTSARSRVIRSTRTRRRSRRVFR